MFNEFQPITTLAEVKAFASYLFFDLSTAFHPEDDFSAYVNASNGNPAFTEIRAMRLNQRMSECANICDLAGVDICEVMDVATPYFEALSTGMDDAQTKKAVYIASDAL